MANYSKPNPKNEKQAIDKLWRIRHYLLAPIGWDNRPLTLEEMIGRMDALERCYPSKLGF